MNGGGHGQLHSINYLTQKQGMHIAHSKTVRNLHIGCNITIFSLDNPETKIWVEEISELRSINVYQRTKPEIYFKKFKYI